MSKRFFTIATAAILNAIASGYSFGFDVIDVTGLPAGTVYPALRRLEDDGFVTSHWENERAAYAKARPRRRYYEITRSGKGALADAMKRYRLFDQPSPAKPRVPRASDT
jgi:DNA-binding PadR family transcriptional regulator